MKGVIQMTLKAQRRCKILEMVIQDKILEKDAAWLLGITSRQVIRILIKYLKDGDESLNHKVIGKPSNHRIKGLIRENIMDIVREKYKGLKPTFISEKLYEDDHIIINANPTYFAYGCWKKGCGKRSGKLRYTELRGQGKNILVKCFKWMGVSTTG